MMAGRRYCLLIFCILILQSFTVHATEQTKAVTVAVGWIKPPYIISHSDSGFELDMVKAIFEQLNQPIKLSYVPHARGYHLLRTKKADVALTLNENIDIGDTAVLSDVYVTYQNVAVSLKKNHLSIKHIARLTNHSIVGFQQANLILGPDFKLASENAVHYQEIADQRKQIKMLLAERAEVIIIDINIFKWLGTAVTGEDPMPLVDVHKIFPSNPYRLGFIDSHLKQRFNQALAKFLASDDYQRLLSKYQLYQ